MGNDPYRDRADRYDLFPEDRSEETGFFEKLFSENRVRRVLDCACGTGNELLIFDALGCDVVGSDISDSMLTHARERIDESGAQIPLHRLDYRRLPDKFTEEFDAVVCWSASRFCARDRRRRRAQGVLEYAKHSLQRGGAGHGPGDNGRIVCRQRAVLSQ